MFRISARIMFSSCKLTNRTSDCSVTIYGNNPRIIILVELYFQNSLFATFIRGLDIQIWTF